MSSTIYTIQVAAVNNASTGIYSDIIHTMTDGELIANIIKECPLLLQLSFILL